MIRKRMLGRGGLVRELSLNESSTVGFPMARAERISISCEVQYAFIKRFAIMLGAMRQLPKSRAFFKRQPTVLTLRNIHRKLLPKGCNFSG